MWLLKLFLIWRLDILGVRDKVFIRYCLRVWELLCFLLRILLMNLEICFNRLEIILSD